MTGELKKWYGQQEQLIVQTETEVPQCNNQ